jgi:signal transduction histidine kinase
MSVAAGATMLVDSNTASVILAISVMGGLGFAGVTFIRRAQTLEADERRAWRLLGLGLLITALGIVVLSVLWIATSSVGAFSPIDFLYLAGYSIGLLGFAMLPHTGGTRLQRTRLLLDGLIGAIAVGTLLWALLLQDILSSLRAAPVLDRTIGTAFIFLDVMLLVVLMIVVVRRSSLRFDLRLVLFGLAGVSQAIADIAFLESGAGKQFAEAEPLYPMNIAAVAFFIATALVVDQTPREREYADRTRTPIWAVGLPYGFALTLVTILFMRFPQSAASTTDTGLLHATAVIAGLVIFRQAVAIRVNRRFVDNQRTALVSSISHELRTPLTAMVGFLDLLDSGSVDSEEERREMTSIVADQASYLARIVSDLVMLASDSAGEMDLDITPTPVDELAWASVNSAAIDSTSVRVEADRHLTAYVDKGRVTQAVANLLSNAVRYGGDRVALIATADGGDLTVEVHDNGEGVPRKYELTIWEKFERGPNPLNATVPGSGIGLAVANAITKAHGGAAGYRRSPRLGGACFWLRLPGRVQVDAETPKRLFSLQRDGNARSA